MFFELKQGVCTGVKNGQILTFFLTHFWQFVHTVYSKFLTSFSKNKNAGSVPKNTKFLGKKMVEKCRRKKKFDKNCQKFDKNCQKFDNFLTFFFFGGSSDDKNHILGAVLGVQKCPKMCHFLVIFRVQKWPIFDPWFHTRSSKMEVQNQKFRNFRQKTPPKKMAKIH